MTKRNKIMIFIDHNNIFRVYQKWKKKFDYVKLKNIIKGDRDLIATYTFMGVEPAKNPSRKKGFYEFLKKNKIIPKTANIKIKPDGTRLEKEIDIALSTEMLSSAYENRYDIAAIVSGDGDYKPVIEKVISLRKVVEVWSFRGALSYRLSEIVLYNNIYYLDDYLDELELE